MGQSLLEYWLAHLASSGPREVMILAHDRPARLLEHVGDGARWGLTVEVAPESRELSPAQALLKYGHELDPVSTQSAITVLDHFPGMVEMPMFEGYQQWFAALRAWIPRALTPDRVGVRELRPGVHVGLHSRIDPTAKLESPCWIGDYAFVGADAVVGSGSIIERGSIIEPQAEIRDTYVGAFTFVGRYAELASSLAFGSTLINWQTGSAAKVPDPFLLCALRAPSRSRSSAWLSRVAEFYSRGKSDFFMVWKHLLLNKGG
jgi:NDP-sugar pyrophosphorylase family protein